MSVDYEKLQKVFLGAVEQHPPDQWDVYLDEACAGDAELRGEVVLLLKAHAQGESLPDGGLPWNRKTGIYEPITERPGTVIGPYKLLEQIGEGGMGTVWMAQQTEPVKRVVALKLIKAGMDSKQVIARFEAERQALALMEHTNIARVLDAGTTSAGRPYFVMDLVKGVPFTKYCDEHHVTPRQRLELFIPVCQAIQHAHQKGIIHRDLKPSNVLVALYDGKPVPKVIDFGVAKAAGQPLTEKTLVTGFGNIVGTLEYMSPEQAEVNQLDIDTRSDIYSLGVLLYELLAGSPPFTRKDLEKAGMLEMLRVIREQEPSKPSTKLSTADGLPTLAANRGTEPAKLTKLVRGELDWIVMKALEKDRNRRYETANGFAMDVQRYLADEPVQACPPSVGYRFQKFARRNKVTISIAGLVLLILLSLTGGIGWNLRDRAARTAALEHEVQAALRDAHKGIEAQKWTEAMSAVLRAEGLLAVVGRSTELRDRVQELKTDLNMVARLEDIRLRRGQSKISLTPEGKVERVEFAWAEAIREYAEAFRSYGIDVTTVEPQAAAGQIRTRSISSALVAALDDWAFLDLNGKLFEVARLADTDEPRRQLRATLNEPERNMRLLKELAATDKIDMNVTTANMFVYALLNHDNKHDNRDIRGPRPPRGAGASQNHDNKHDNRDMEETVRLGVQRRYPDDFWANYDLGLFYSRSGKPADAAQAVRYFTAAAALRPDSAEAHRALGNALLGQNDADGAVAAFRAALRHQPQHVEVRLDLAIALRVKGLMNEAIAESREVIELAPKNPWPHVNRALAHVALGHWAKAAADYERGLELDPNNYENWRLTAYARLAAGDADGYRRTCREFVERFDKTKDPVIAERMAKTCALAPGAVADFSRVEKLAELAVTGTEKHRYYRYFVLAKGLTEYRAGRHAEAIKWLELFAPKAGGVHWDATSFAALAMAQYRLGRTDEAKTILAKANAIIKAKLPDPSTGQLFRWSDWHDWVHAQILSREAEELLKKE
jgi:serine/threonine protein kinase/Flp pilus assembly protein TadD